MIIWFTFGKFEFSRHVCRLQNPDSELVLRTRMSSNVRISRQILVDPGRFLNSVLQRKTSLFTNFKNWHWDVGGASVLFWVERPQRLCFTRRTEKVGPDTLLKWTKTPEFSWQSLFWKNEKVISCPKYFQKCKLSFSEFVSKYLFLKAKWFLSNSWTLNFLVTFLLHVLSSEATSQFDVINSWKTVQKKTWKSPNEIIPED